MTLFGVLRENASPGNTAIAPEEGLNIFPPKYKGRHQMILSFTLAGSCCSILDVS
jgi:hypothetical protein